MPPLIRKAPLSERIKTLLNPYDFLLWLSEELHESAVDEKLRDWTVPIGLAANFFYMIAGANSAGERRGRRDDVFGDFDGRGGSGWFAWFASFTAHTLALLSVLNALYLFTRTRKYRLFESNIEAPPSTPSARRVRVDSSPLSNSPLSYLSAKFASTTAASRAHPDSNQDVWELSVWDPKPLHLSLFTLFSPGHVLVYWLFLPTSPVDPRPSVTVATTIILATLLSAQLMLFKSFFESKSRDDKILQKEVLNEYDTKFVHPSLNRPIRDVGTQSIESFLSPGKRSREVEVGTPTTIVNRGWKVNPNPNYAQHLGDRVDTDKLYAETPARRVSGRFATSLLSPTPASYGQKSAYTTSSTGMQSSRDEYSTFNPSPPKPMQPLRQQASQPSLSSQYQQPSRDRTSTFPRNTAPESRGDGGSLGVFSHAASPLRKGNSGPAPIRSGTRVTKLDFTGGAERGGSPLKRMSMAGNNGDVSSENTAPTSSRKSLGGGNGLFADAVVGSGSADARVRARREERERKEREAAKEKGADDALRQRLDGLRRESRPY